MRKHNYVIGYEAEGNVAYGKDNPNGTSDYIHLMTLFQAKQAAKRLVTEAKRKTHKGNIYKLVKVNP